MGDAVDVLDDGRCSDLLLLLRGVGGDGVCDLGWKEWVRRSFWSGAYGGPRHTHVGGVALDLSVQAGEPVPKRADHCCALDDIVLHGCGCSDGRRGEKGESWEEEG